jgi:uncharacterized protein (DUF2141 family)
MAPSSREPDGTTTAESLGEAPMTNPLFPATLFLAVCLAPSLAYADDLDIALDVEDLRSDRGEVRGALYASPDGWTREGREIATCHARIEHRHAHCVFENVEPGTYAIAFLHDEDDDGRMDRDFFGFPQEGFGFSNDAAPSLGPPSFNAARFAHDHENTTLRVRTRYGI